jgi:hypothetical protein
MAIKVFFSFDYELDLWRVNQIKNIPNIIRCAAAGFQDSSLWEEAKRKGDTEIKKIINDNLDDTSVTVVCIGPMTYFRKHINYATKKSMERNNGILGIHINRLLDHDQSTCDHRGIVPIILAQPNQRRYQIYDYTNVQDLARWIELAMAKAGSYPKKPC